MWIMVYLAMLMNHQDRSEPLRIIMEFKTEGSCMTALRAVREQMNATAHETLVAICTPK